MELEPREYRLKTPPTSSRVLGDRVVGHFIEPTTPRRSVLIIARTVDKRPRETRLYALKANNTLSLLININHNNFSEQLLQLCGVNPQSPMFRHEISVASATATPDQAFIAVALECRVFAKTTNVTELPTNTISFQVALFHPATELAIRVESSQDRHLFPILTHKSTSSSEPVLLVLSQYVSPDLLDTLFVLGENETVPQQTELRVRKQQKQIKHQRGKQQGQTHITEFKLTVNTGTVSMMGHEFSNPFQSRKLTALRLSTTARSNEVLWCGYDPWDYSILTFMRMAEHPVLHSNTVGLQLSPMYSMKYVELDNSVMPRFIGLQIPVAIRSKFDRIHSGINCGRDQPLNMRRWVTRSGTDAIAIQLIEKRVTPGLAIHCPAKGSLLGPSEVAKAYFGTDRTVDGHAEQFSHKFTQLCVGGCQLVYFKYHGHRDDSIAKFMTIDLDRVVDNLERHHVYEIFRIDDHGRLQRSKQQVKFTTVSKFPLPSFTHARRFVDWDSFGFGEYHRIAVCIDGSTQYIVEIAVPVTTSERVSFVRTYGMLAILFYARPAVLIDLEISPPRYMFSCPLIDHPDGVGIGGMPEEPRDANVMSHRRGRSDSDSMRDLTPGASLPSTFQSTVAVGAVPGASASAAAPPNDSVASSKGTDNSSSRFAPAEKRRKYPPMSQRHNFLTVPSYFGENDAEEDNNRPSEAVTEALSVDPSAHGRAPQPSLEPAVFDVIPTFDGVMEHVVVPHIRTVLDPEVVLEHVHHRGMLLRHVRRSMLQRTRREAAMLAVLNALTIACSRLVYLPNGRMVTFEAVGQWFETIALEIFRAPSSSMRSPCLYMLLGFFAEAFQRISCGHRIAEATAQQKPDEATLSSARTFTGFNSKFRLWCELFPHPELAPLLHEDHVSNHKAGLGAFRYMPPSRQMPHVEQRRDSRWVSEAGNPAKSTEYIHVMREWTRPQAGSMAFKPVTVARVPRSRFFDRTMPNPAAVPIVDTSDKLDVTERDDVITTASQRRFRASREARVNSGEARTRTISQVDKLVAYVPRTDSRSQGSRRRAGDPAASGDSSRRSSLPYEARRLLKHSITTCETRLRSLKESDADQLLAFVDIALAIDFLRSQTLRDQRATLAPVMERQLRVAQVLASPKASPQPTTREAEGTSPLPREDDGDAAASPDGRPATMARSGSSGVPSPDAVTPAREAEPPAEDVSREFTNGGVLPPTVLKMLQRRGLYTPPPSEPNIDSEAGSAHSDRNEADLNNDSVAMMQTPAGRWSGTPAASPHFPGMAGTPRVGGWPTGSPRHRARCDFMASPPAAAGDALRESSAFSASTESTPSRLGATQAPSSGRWQAQRAGASPVMAGLPGGGTSRLAAGQPASVTQAQRFADVMLRVCPHQPGAAAADTRR